MTKTTDVICVACKEAEREVSYLVELPLVTEKHRYPVKVCEVCDGKELIRLAHLPR